MAILLALASPELELIGVTTTFGNCPAMLTARGALAVLKAAGRGDIPVCAGLELPLAGRHHTELLEAWSGSRGAPGVINLPALDGNLDPRRAPDFIVEQASRFPGEVEIVAIGPQTNLAAAFLLDPDLKRKLRGVTFMGGGLGLEPTYGRGNVTPVAECNMWFDPLAAKIVLESGVPLVMVGLDVTNPRKGTILSEEQLRRIDPAQSEAAALLSTVCETYLESPMFAFDGHRGCVLYDPLAVAVCIDSSLVTLTPMNIVVEQSGAYGVGQTIPLRNGEPNVAVATNVDGNRAAQLILDRLLTI
jgi:inosine-uridine nucleoside N-ribohydrolase